MESISNPLVRVTDLAGVAGFARRHGITPVVDNTFASPVLCRPADMGFVVVHSATKFLNGHSDLLAGVVSSSRDFIGKACAPSRLRCLQASHAGILLLACLVSHPQLLWLRVQRLCPCYVLHKMPSLLADMACVQWLSTPAFGMFSRSPRRW